MKMRPMHAFIDGGSEAEKNIVGPALLDGSLLFGLGWGMLGICPARPLSVSPPPWSPPQRATPTPRRGGRAVAIPGFRLFFAASALGLLVGELGKRRKNPRAGGTTKAAAVGGE